jgi:hypothetical protein
MTDTGSVDREPGQRISPRALYALLDTSHAESAATLVQTTAMAKTHLHRSRERRLIGVAKNTILWQMRLTAERRRHHAITL